jgi:hypothetical protein
MSGSSQFYIVEYPIRSVIEVSATHYSARLTAVFTGLPYGLGFQENPGSAALKQQIASKPVNPLESIRPFFLLHTHPCRQTPEEELRCNNCYAGSSNFRAL